MILINGPLQMAEGDVKAASATKPAGGADTEAEVNIEDFRGDSATDDISRQAVMKSLVDIEQKGAMQHMLCCTIFRTLQNMRFSAYPHAIVRMPFRFCGGIHRNSPTHLRSCDWSCRGACKLERHPQKRLERKWRYGVLVIAAWST